MLKVQNECKSSVITATAINIYNTGVLLVFMLIVVAIVFINTITEDA